MIDARIELRAAYRNLIVTVNERFHKGLLSDDPSLFQRFYRKWAMIRSPENDMKIKEVTEITFAR